DYPLVHLTEPELATLPADVEDVWPLAPIQHGMLFHALYEPDVPLYSNQLHLVLDGDLNHSLFEQAWQRVVDSHAVLRSTFRWRGFREPVQLIARAGRVEFRSEDVSSLNEHEQKHCIAGACDADWREPYEIERGPLMRLAVFKLAPDRHHVVWS